MATVTVIVDNVAKEVGIVSAGDAYSVTIEGRAYMVTDVRSSEGTLAFLVDRHSHVAHVSDGPGGARLSIGGRNYRLAEETMDTDRPGPSVAGAGGSLEAPMPGSIVAICVGAGDRVGAGQPVVVLESMKMQNEIASPIDGVVRRIHCKVGDQVGFGDALAEISPREGNE